MSLSKTLLIENQWYVIQGVPGDGNCFFHCLSLSFFGDLNHAAQMRHDICSNIAENWFVWQHDAKLYHDSVATRLTYVSSMLSKNGWATAAEIRSAAEVLQCKINVWLEDVYGRYTKHCYSCPAQPKKIINLHLRNSHFQLLMPVDH